MILALWILHSNKYLVCVRADLWIVAIVRPAPYFIESKPWDLGSVPGYCLSSGETGFGMGVGKLDCGPQTQYTFQQAVDIGGQV